MSGLLEALRALLLALAALAPTTPAPEPTTATTPAVVASLVVEVPPVEVVVPACEVTETGTWCPASDSYVVDEPLHPYFSLEAARVADFDALAGCETGGTWDWAINTGNGYFGGLQFGLPAWQHVGGEGYPHEASREEQIWRGHLLQEDSGWGQWPACSRKLGLR